MRIRDCVSLSNKSRFAPSSVLVKIPKVFAELLTSRGTVGFSVPIPTFKSVSIVTAGPDAAPALDPL